MRLKTDRGTTQIAYVVVAKIARLATREVSGVYAMGRGLARAIAGVRSVISPSATESSTMGVSVEVGEQQAAVDIDIVAEYGLNLLEVAETVRANVIDRIESMTGLEVIEVNITVDDVHMEGEDTDTGPSRVS
jgi:uncharacterized alkaline shock family protein YloU